MDKYIAELILVHTERGGGGGGRDRERAKYRERVLACLLTRVIVPTTACTPPKDP